MDYNLILFEVYHRIIVIYSEYILKYNLFVVSRLILKPDIPVLYISV